MGNKENLLIYAGIAISMFFLAYLFLAFVFPPTPGHPSTSSKEKYLYHMPSLIVNLSGSGGKRYLKIEVIIEYTTLYEKKVQALFRKKKVFLTDTLIMLLSDKTVTAIDGQANKEILKEEIRQKFENILFSENPIGSISAIYYKTFLIQ